MLDQAFTEPDEHPDLPRVVDLHQRIRRVVAAVVAASRLVTLGMVALSVVALVQAHGYTWAPLAGVTYVCLGGWSAVFLLLVWRRDPVPGWALGTDVAVTAVGVVAVSWSARTEAFDDLVANADLEPTTVAVAVGVALISASAWRTTACCVALAVAYGLAHAPAMSDGASVTSDVSTVAWQVGAAWCCYLFITRLRDLAHLFATATEQVVAARERVAAHRAHHEERQRHFQEQVRRYRALHDGPLRILTAIAGPGPAGHPDPQVRRQCAVSVNVLRGATPDEPGGTLTDLSLALIEAGNDSAACGLRVEYHFANLPDDLPSQVAEGLRLATAEALSNVVTHAGVTRARVTARATGEPERPTVLVAIVDQGSGFDPRSIGPGYGIRHSIIDRMDELGGAATVDSHPGQGTRVDLRWPR
ncbi:MAG: sensor histidine kinase [Mycobacteriales bacterium]